MLKERRAIVANVQGHLHDSEMAVEATLAAIGRLMIALPDARVRAGISAAAGQAAFDSIAAAMAGIVEVRGHMVEAHRQLESARMTFRLPVVDAGAGWIKPSAEEPHGVVKLVASGAAV